MKSMAVLNLNVFKNYLKKLFIKIETFLRRSLLGDVYNQMGT